MEKQQKKTERKKQKKWSYEERNCLLISTTFSANDPATEKNRKKHGKQQKKTERKKT